MTRLLLLLLAALNLSACGFQLRGAGSLPVAMKQIYVSGLPVGDPLSAALTTALTRAGANVVSSAGHNAIRLQLSTDETKRSISLNRNGLSREFDLGYHLTYAINAANGATIEPLQKLKINREQYNDQFLILGRVEEEAQLRQEMREEAADTLVRRMIFLLKQKSRE